MSGVEGGAEVYELVGRRAARQDELRRERADEAAGEALGPCVECGGYDEQAVLVGVVASVSEPDRAQYACAEHAARYGDRERDLGALARTRAQVTGESVERARAALTGGGRARVRAEKGDRAAGGGQRRRGWYSWHRGWAQDVVPASSIEQGTGPGVGQYACLACARSLARQAGAPGWPADAVAVLEQRAAAADQGPCGDTP